MMTTAYRSARAALAAATLLALVVGIPMALVRFGAAHLPERLPGLDALTVALLHPEDGRMLVGLLILAVWAFWIYLVVTVAMDVVDVLRNGIDVLHQRRVGPRALTGTLILWALTTLTSQPGTATQPVTSPVLIAVQAPSTPDPAVATYVVEPRDTLWDIAFRELGDPLRWREILDLNRDRVQADDARLTDAGHLRPGWVLALPPAQPSGEIAVRPGDSLASIAQDQLGDPHRYPEIFDASRDIVQPDGARLTDPRVIRPGWLLRLPDSADAPSTPEREASPTPSAAPEPPVATPPIEASRPSAEHSAAPPSTEQPAPPTRIPAPPQPAAEPAQDESTPLPLLVGLGGAAATGFLGLLLHLRRRQRRFREYRRQIALPTATDAVVEAPVRRAAIAGPDTELLHSALRLAAAEAPPPNVNGAVSTPDGVVLLGLRGQPAPSAFETTAEGDWLLPTATTAPTTARNGYPALASLGRLDDGSTVFTDLEADGVLHLVGSRHQAGDLLRHITLELGTSEWADDLELIVVGLEPDLTPLGHHKVETFRDLDEALQRFTTILDASAPELDGSDIPAPARRAAGDPSEALVVRVLVVHAVDMYDEQLLHDTCDRLLGRGRTSAVVLTSSTATPLPGPRLSIDQDGVLADIEWAGERVKAEQLSRELGQGLLDILATADEPDQPVPPARGDQPWAQQMTLDGSWEPEPAEIVPDDPPEPFPQRTTKQERRLTRVENDDPDLDDDLAEWGDTETPARPLVAVLGKPAVRAPGGPPPGRAAWQIEVVVYLAFHERGVSREKMATDLWVDGKAASPSGVRRTIAELRPWIGKHPTRPDVEFVPSLSTSGDGRYRLTGHLLDWDLFRRLRKRAQARAAAGRVDDARADYRSALRLVRGPVLSPRRDRGYAWLSNPDQHHDALIPGFVIDTAHELVDLALANDDLEEARWAAEIARMVDPDSTHDNPFLDLMRIAHAEGDTGAMRQYAELLLAERDFEVGEDLPPASFEVFHRLFPNGLGRPVDDE
ncbi:LysM peptidoglycan-binding domain-containing protein [Pseudonocardia oroxyli]|uniref:LysM domain-containing protein n=1 Tax=Pseudonocardia oroxyli TaxID=366584 RepID=A0A1G7WZR2_PSEOR|nr:LysM peptidoglycan-binding domain-containing protein [Pseudonocardia oroxyli]SDG77396.1 LysM domain-containing protein [Pseudonocardia oroxyli]